MGQGDGSMAVQFRRGKAGFQKAVRAVALVAALGQGLSSPVARALDNITTSASSIQTSALQADYGSCDDICTKVDDAITSASASSGEIDKDMCASACATVDSGGYPNKEHCFQAPTYEDKTCSVPKQILDNVSGTCEEVNQKITGCKFYGSTVAGQCSVVKKSKSSTAYHEILLILDGVAAGSCATACVAEKSGVAAALKPVCMHSAWVAGGAEAVASLLVATPEITDGQQSGITAVSGVGGAAAAITGGVMAATGSRITHAESCVSMALYLALGGIRIYSMVDAKKTYEAACTEATALYSAAYGAAIAAGGDAVVNPNNPMVVGSSGALTGTTASGASYSVSGGVGGDKSQPTVGDMMGGEAFAASTEGQILSRSGLLETAKPLVSQVDREALRKAIATNGASGFVQHALGNVGLSADQAKQALAVAENAYKKGSVLASRISGSTYAASAGKAGGTSASASNAAPANPFAGLMGGAKAASGNESLAFGVTRAPAAIEPGRPSDIFHPARGRSLFDIITQRVRVAESRLQ